MSEADILSQTLKKIEEEAKKKAEEIIARAKEEARQMLSETAAEVEKTKKEKIAQEKEKLEFELQQELHAAKWIARQKVLQTKKEVIDGVKQEVLTRLKKISPERKREILGKMLRIAKKHIPEGFVYANDEDAELVKGFAVYPLKGTIKCAGGIIVEEKNGEKVLDLRYETLLERIFVKRGEEIWKMLFE